MLFKFLKKSSFAGLIMLLAFSCKKDLGNYEYINLNEPTAFVGLNDTTAFFGKRFVMKPEVLFSKDILKSDTSRYSYEWSYAGPNGLGGSALYRISNARYLDINMSLAAGTYPFYYAVTDNESGVKYRKEFIITVVNQINEGWLLLSEVNGTARLDMLSKSTTGTFDVINDLLGTTVSGLTLQGKPKFLYTYNTGANTGVGINLSYGIYVGTDASTNRLDPETFKWLPGYNVKFEILDDLPANFTADLVRQSGSTRSYLVGNHNAYIYERVTNVKYSVPINIIAGQLSGFRIAPFVANNYTSSTAAAILYDIDNKRFVKHTGTNSTSSIIPDPSGKLFSYTTGLDLLYMTWVPFNGGEVFSILKDPVNAKRYLARFNPISNAQSYYAEILATDFANAEQYAVSPTLGYVFYSVGAKVYEYDMSTKVTKLMLDKGTEKVSLIKFNEFLNSTKYTDGTKLIVCSYDPLKPEGTNGKMELYTVPTIQGDLVLTNSYSGFGKVQSINYRER
ncbi:PKD-like family lipoprotein [Desertivirga arenae]|uniref:PKD-like family lipoprotein n=1 Tax=Desertivirga arenae TaxID=2810309 RepID=UPI001A964ADB|nr:PKD-like family lipoprotein [Pedobacter sp. SYSU D00823]